MLLEHFGRSADENDVTALAPCHGTDVDDIIGLQHHFLVVLHDEDRVTIVSQSLQGVQQALVVALMQTDGRLVKNIKHIDQARTDLGGQPDALALATRKRRRIAVERHVVQPHLQQEVQT